MVWRGGWIGYAIMQGYRRKLLGAAGGAGGPFDKASVTVTNNKAINQTTAESKGIFMTPDHVVLVYEDAGNSSRVVWFDPTDFTTIDFCCSYDIGANQIFPFHGGIADNDSCYFFGEDNGVEMVVFSTSLDGTTINWATKVDVTGGSESFQFRNAHIQVDNNYVWMACTETALFTNETVHLHQFNKFTGAHNWSRDIRMNTASSYNVNGLTVDFLGNCYFTSEYRTRGTKCINSSGTVVWENYLGGTGIAPDGYFGCAYFDGHIFVSFVDNNDIYVVKQDATDGTIVADNQIEAESGFIVSASHGNGSNSITQATSTEIIVCAPRDTANRFYVMWIDPSDCSVNDGNYLSSSIGNPINQNLAVANTGNDGVVITCESGGNYTGILNTTGDGTGDGFTDCTPVEQDPTVTTQTVSGHLYTTLSPTVTSPTVVRQAETNPSIRNWTGI